MALPSVASLSQGYPPQQPTAVDHVVLASTPEILRKTQDALGSVKSYRVRMEWLNGGKAEQVIEEVVCPDSKHIRFIENGRTASDIYILKGIEYYKKKGGQYVPMPLPLTLPPTPKVVSGCPGGQEDWLGGELPPSEAVKLLIRSGTTGRRAVSKGERKQLDGVSCEPWEIEGNPGDPLQQDITLCINPDNDLPMQMTVETTYGRSVATYSDWNSEKMVIKPFFTSSR